MTLQELPSQSTDDWSNEWAEALTPPTDEYFSIKKTYESTEFLRILRLTLNRLLQSSQRTSTSVDVLELWEKRVLDFMGEYPEDAGKLRIRFSTYDDGSVHIVLETSLSQ